MKKLYREVFAKHASRFFLVVMSLLLIFSLCSADGSPTVTVNFTNNGNVPQDIDVVIGDYLGEGTNITVGNTYNIPYTTIVNVVDGVLDLGDGFVLPVPYGDGTYALITCSYRFSSDDVSGLVLDNPVATYQYERDNALFTYYVCDVINLSLIEETHTLPGFDMMMIFVPVEVTPPDYVSPLTSVWTSITNWVISSLNTVQGVFYGAGEEVITPDTSSSDTIVYDGVTFYPIDFLRVEDAGGYRAYFNGVEIFENGFSQIFTSINGQQVSVVSNSGVPVFIRNVTTAETYSPQGLEIVIQSDDSLTLLGTLAVIGVSISIAFLVIGVISRFLKLRG